MDKKKCERIARTEASMLQSTDHIFTHFSHGYFQHMRRLSYAKVGKYPHNILDDP